MKVARRGGRSGPWRGLLVIAALAIPVGFEFRGLVTHQSYTENWLFRYDPLLSSDTGAAPPRRAARVVDTSPAVLNAVADRFASESYRRLELPLWNPYQALGTPLAAEMNSPVLSPFRLLLLYLPGVTDYRTSLFFAFNVLLGSAGVVLWLRSAGVSGPASVAAAVAYAFAGDVIEGFRFSDLPANMLAPFLLWRIEALIARQGLLEALTLGALAGITVLSAHVVGAFLALLAAALYYFSRAAQLAAPRRARAALLGLAALAMAAAASAVAWVPFLEFLRAGWTYKLRQPDGSFTYAPPHLLWPHLYALRRYVAIAPLIWAAAGLALRSPLRAPLLVLGGVGLGLAYDPPLLGALKRLPGLDLIQAPYAHFVLVLAVVGLAATTLDALPRVGPRTLAAAGLSVTIALVALSLRPASPGPLLARSPGERAREELAARQSLRLRMLSAALAAGLAGGLAAGRRLGWRPGGVFVGVAACVVVLGEVIPRSAWLVEPEPAFDFPETPALRFLEAGAAHGERVSAVSTDDSDFGSRAHMPNAGLVTHLADTRGCQALFVERSHRLLWMIGGADPRFPTWLLLHRYPGLSPGTPLPEGAAGHRPATALEMLGVRFLLRPPGSPVAPGHRRVFESATIAIDENPAAFGRAFLVHHAVAAASADEAAAALERGVDFRRQAVIEGAATGLTAPPPPGADAQDRVELTGLAPREVVVRAATGYPAYLVLSDSFYPGWRATVDGDRAAILPANLALRAVYLAPGEHRVVFRYDPPSVRAGLALGFAGLAAWAAAAVGRRRRLPLPTEAGRDDKLPRGAPAIDGPPRVK